MVDAPDTRAASRICWVPESSTAAQGSQPMGEMMEDHRWSPRLHGGWRCTRAVHRGTESSELNGRMMQMKGRRWCIQLHSGYTRAVTGGAGVFVFTVLARL